MVLSPPPDCRPVAAVLKRCLCSSATRNRPIPGFGHDASTDISAGGRGFRSFGHFLVCTSSSTRSATGLHCTR
ncbi:hypothetical protein XA68_13842 [Ophiocordyceps unilateralis]|uniref:Uncharacterized protein n=1 Tax=Ophiocordyceps unilateralis TaxID=268505 RepID=A0A2A9PNC1_OPHUN|nr:hypothetical protein XA68_13842 [Ophiocordyceps unilateralis]